MPTKENQQCNAMLPFYRYVVLILQGWNSTAKTAAEWKSFGKKVQDMHNTRLYLAPVPMPPSLLLPFHIMNFYTRKCKNMKAFRVLVSVQPVPFFGSGDQKFLVRKQEKSLSVGSSLPIVETEVLQWQKVHKCMYKVLY